MNEQPDDLQEVPTAWLLMELRRREIRQAHPFIRFAAEQLRETVADIMSDSRRQPLASKRQVAMAAMYALGGSNHGVKLAFDKGCHTTVVFARKKCDRVKWMGKARREIVKRWLRNDEHSKEISVVDTAQRDCRHGEQNASHRDRATKNANADCRSSSAEPSAEGVGLGDRGNPSERRGRRGVL